MDPFDVLVVGAGYARLGVCGRMAEEHDLRVVDLLFTDDSGTVRLGRLGVERPLTAADATTGCLKGQNTITG